jgi:site-specific DNA recombinase
LSAEVGGKIARVIVSANKVCVTPTDSRENAKPIEIASVQKTRENVAQPDLIQPQTDQKLLKSIIRAHTWLNDLSSGRYRTIENLAAVARLHPKVIRQELRLAFLSPALTASVLSDRPQLTLKQIPKGLPLSWREHVPPDLLRA